MYKQSLVVLLTLLVIAGGWYRFDLPGSLSVVPDIQLHDIQTCQSTPIMIMDGSAVDVKETTLLSWNDTVRFLVCEPGKLSFFARGSLARGHGSHLVVSWRDQTLWEGEVTDEKVFEISIPGPGWVALAFVNELYEPPEDRNLWLSQIEFLPGLSQ